MRTTADENLNAESSKFSERKNTKIQRQKEVRERKRKRLEMHTESKCIYIRKYRILRQYFGQVNRKELSHSFFIVCRFVHSNLNYLFSAVLLSRAAAKV